MTGTLCAVALFMFTYKGYQKADLWAAKLAAVFALGVAFFPTNNYDELSACKVLALDGNKTINIIHFTSAALLFIIFAFFSLILFTKSSGHKTKRKKQRNIVYRVCGIVILLSIGLLLIYALSDSLQDKLRQYKPIFWLETSALIAFGTSWLTKGEGLLWDKED